MQPSKEARKKFLLTLGNHIGRCRDGIEDVLSAQDSFAHRQRYVQTLDLLDRVIRGWGNSFAYSNATSTTNDLDEKIERKIENFRSWFHRKLRDGDWKAKRRTGGVCLLADIKPKSLDELPFRLGDGKRHRRTKDMIVISTDGSVVGAGPRAGRDRGPGGWGLVFHGDGTEASGRASDVTNNEMELTAVIEALKRTPPGSRVRIRTDSQYVHRAVHENAMIRSNAALWNEYRNLSAERRIDLVWIPGHASDPHNERADELARQQARGKYLLHHVATVTYSSNRNLNISTIASVSRSQYRSNDSAIRSAASPSSPINRSLASMANEPSCTSRSSSPSLGHITGNTFLIDVDPSNAAST